MTSSAAAYYGGPNAPLFFASSINPISTRRYVQCMTPATTNPKSSATPQTKPNKGLVVRTSVKAGDWATINHGMRLKSNIGLVVRTSVKAGILTGNHGLRLASLR